MTVPPHGDCCDCAASPRAPGASGWIAMLVPVLACAVCPACLSTYANLLSLLGVGVAVTEAEHHTLLGLAVGASLLVGAWRSWRARRLWPIAVAAAGCALLVGGHVTERTSIEWAGVAALLGGGILEQIRHLRAHRRRGKVAAVVRLTARPNAR